MGTGMANPVHTLLQHFPDEFRAHMRAH